MEYRGAGIKSALRAFGVCMRKECAQKVKKILFMLPFVLLLSAASAACSVTQETEYPAHPTEIYSQDSDEPAAPNVVEELPHESPPQLPQQPAPEPISDEASEAATEEAADESTEFGIIVGDVYYRGIPISRLFTEPFSEVLGQPLSVQGSNFSYAGLEIRAGWGNANRDMAIRIEASEPYLNLFELNGISLDICISEVRAAFGVAAMYWDNTYTYHISSPVADYMLTFRLLANRNDNTFRTGILIWRETEYSPVYPLGADYGTPISSPGIASIAYACEDDMEAHPNAPRFVWTDVQHWMVFRFDEPVSDVALVRIFNVGFLRGAPVPLYEIQYTEFEAGDLASGQPVFIRTIGHFGTMPGQAIGFTHNGIRYYIPFDKSQADDGCLQLHEWAAFTFD